MILPTPETTHRLILVGRRPLEISGLLAVARGEAHPLLDPDPELHRRLRRGAEMVSSAIAEGRAVYGVTTGVGNSCEVKVPSEVAGALPLNLVRFHGCGTGRILDDVESAAVMTARLASLASGGAGVRVVVIERLCDMLRLRILPRIPSEGSVGASGDLTPLSYVAAAMVGEREVSWRGRIVPAAQALEEARLQPLTLLPKESLAIMNGTSFMTGLGCLVWAGARRLGRLAAALTAMASDVLRGNPEHFDDRLFLAKPHPGQRAAAKWIRDDIENGAARTDTALQRIQDRYSVRCAPHVIGVLLDALAAFRPMLEIELNSTNDNPIVDPDSGEFLHGGNFYGGHVAFAMDGLKTAVASVADLLDRQLALVCNPATSNGLPQDLVAHTGPEAVTHHGFKAMQITASALTAEALKLTMPATSFSRSTESHNQDKVSMGAIAARDAARILELTETVAAICVLAFCQAVDLRGGEGCHQRSHAVRAAVRRDVPMNDADRRQDHDIARVLHLHRMGKLDAGEASFP